MSLVKHETVAVPALPDATEWAHTERVAIVLAKSTMCPVAFKDKPDEIMVAYLSLRAVGVPLSLNTLNQCYVIDKRLNMMAQLQVGIAANHGWELWFEDGECDDTKATVHYQRPGRPERAMTYTIDEARNAHLLDEWVEQEVPTGGKWPDGNLKTRKVKVAVAVDGVPIPQEDLPEWARKAKADGPPRRKDPWFDNRPAMLMARACTKGLRYAAPHLILGIGDTDMGAPAGEPDYIDAEGEEVETPVGPVNRGTGEVVEARSEPATNGTSNGHGSGSDKPNPFRRQIEMMAERAGLLARDLEDLCQATVGKTLTEATLEPGDANKVLAAVRRYGKPAEPVEAASTATSEATGAEQQTSLLDSGEPF
jgi:hypothetical protein